MMVLLIDAHLSQKIKFCIVRGEVWTSLNKSGQIWPSLNKSKQTNKQTVLLILALECVPGHPTGRFAGRP